MNFSEKTNLTLSIRSAAIIIVGTASLIFGAGGWATTIVGIPKSITDLRSEIRTERVKTEERLSRLESDSLKLKICVNIMAQNNRQIVCKLD